MTNEVRGKNDGKPSRDIRDCARKYYRYLFMNINKCCSEQNFHKWRRRYPGPGEQIFKMSEKDNILDRLQFFSRLYIHFLCSQYIYIKISTNLKIKQFPVDV